MTVVRLGMFETIRQAGAGGMGSVWEAKHVVTETPVAIKFLISDRAREARNVAALKAEARMIARLEHPRIVRIHDVGTLPENSTIPGLPPGSPYIVMDWVPRSLADLPRPLAWENTRALLLEILDALAHVHARGLVHRDIKPSNVLGTLGRLRLADFGIAQLRDVRPEDDQPSSSGTPAFMAPEQFTRSAGEVGPGTDLYAVGCLAYLLATGDYPFHSENYVGIALEHLQASFPVDPFTDELAHWFRRTTAKSPRARYPFAADAARDLARIDQAFSQPSTSPTERFVSPYDTAAETMPMTTIVLDDTSLPSTARIWQDAATRDTAPRAVPGWRVSEAQRSHVEHMRGAGLEVSVMRYPPFVGREAERDDLWETFRETVGAGRSAATIIVGPSGSGRTRLARWLAERAHELGVALHLPFVTCEDGGDPIVRAVRRNLGLAADDLEYVDDHLDRVLAEEDLSRTERNALSRWLAGELRAHSVSGRIDAVRAGLKICSRGVPLIVPIDDVENASSDLFETVQHLVATGSVAPLQFVMTSSQPLPDPDGVLHIVKLDRLDDTFVHRVVQNLAGLHPDLAAEVVGAAAGNPGHAVALVRGMVERGELRRGRHGFELLSHAELHLPGMDALWRGRLQQLIRDVGTIARDALEVAAALHGEVRFDEWSRSCEAANAFIAPELPGELDVRGFTRRTSDSTWVFADEALRAIVVEEAKRRNTWKSHVAACMQALGDADVDRRAFWEAEVGAFARAARNYLASARRAERLFEASRAMRMVNRARECAARIEGPDGRRIRVEADLVKSSLWGRERIEDAEDLATAAAAIADQEGWEDLLAEANQQLGAFARKRVALRAATTHYENARAGFEKIGDAGGVGMALQGLGMVAVAKGELREAEEHYNDALSVLMPARDLRGSAWCANGLGDVYRKLGELELAQSWYSRALNWFETVGDSYGAMWCVHDLAQARRARGDLEGAEEGYAETVRLARRLGQRIVAPRLNLGIVRCQRGDFDAARSVFEDVLEESIQRSVSGEEGIARICLVPCDAAGEDWASAEENLRIGRQKIGGLVDPDLALMAEIAAERAAASGETALVDRLRAFAVEQRN